jgi:uncharacterized membrane protein YdjX (TVP38/TMEM64 family)
LKIDLKIAGKALRVLLLSVWAAVIIFAAAFYFSDQARFNASNIALYIRSFETELWIVFLVLSALRGFTLLPSTPLVIAGTLLFPEQPWLVLGVSMSGIFISSSLIYFCSEALGFTEYFERKKQNAIDRIRRRLEHPLGLAFVALWSFFPFVPTDAVCYVAGTVRVNFPKFIIAVLFGELILCSIYVFSGSFLLLG